MTVQLPVYNELHVVNRLIDAVASLDYPRDRLQIQVLDDSTDETTRLARARVAHHQARGLDIELVHRLCEIMGDETGKGPDHYKNLVTFVKDRPGHDRRYAVDCTKLKQSLGWKRKVNFDEGLRKTVRWYLDNRRWVEKVKTGEYRKWIEKNYGKR